MTLYAHMLIQMPHGFTREEFKEHYASELEDRTEEVQKLSDAYPNASRLMRIKLSSTINELIRRDEHQKIVLDRSPAFFDLQEYVELYLGTTSQSSRMLRDWLLSSMNQKTFNDEAFEGVTFALLRRSFKDTLVRYGSRAFLEKVQAYVDEVDSQYVKALRMICPDVFPTTQPEE